MNVGDDLVFSNDLCCAFMAAVVRSFERFHPKYYLGRTALQKLVYFSKVLGTPVPCSYEIYTYGPFSDRVATSVDSLLADDVIVDQSTNRSRFSNYRPGANSGELLSAFQHEVNPYQQTIDLVVKSLGSFEPNELELVATLHFVAQKASAIHRRPARKSEVVNEFVRIKKDKFSSQDVDRFYEALVSAGLIKTAQPPRNLLKISSEQDT